MALVRTELVCPQFWEGTMRIELPIMEVGKPLFLSVTIRETGKLEGGFRIVDRLDMFETDRYGYCQRLQIEPIEDET